ncbi:MMB_0454 family protein [Mycoplasmopsis gallinacea]|uniref:Asp23/Gls24 family envelope stress response protein n=1 Tax=Mycoplasmopsis gallinacea TaxID=29556 RepID=A0A449A3Y3_9BACT|nr:hypothetical protein [Mycoplasmopsis gallinacea]VEU58961.1 Uncharacterised protein [Mycoplasmopsis gallinacea]
MNSITVSNNKILTYVVEESALFDSINIAIKQIKYVRLIGDPRLSFDDSKSNLQIYLSIKINTKNEGIDSFDVLKEVVSSVEKACSFLIDQKPINVQVVVLDNN